MIPVLGVIPAVVAVVLFHKVRNEAGRAWNPARGYLLCGCVLAWLGISINVLALGSRIARHLH
jgi:hypothetical protein